VNAFTFTGVSFDGKSAFEIFSDLNSTYQSAQNSIPAYKDLSADMPCTAVNPTKTSPTAQRRHTHRLIPYACATTMLTYVLHVESKSASSMSIQGSPHYNRPIPRKSRFHLGKTTSAWGGIGFYISFVPALPRAADYLSYLYISYIHIALTIAVLS
jgi:hypothetical protein